MDCKFVETVAVRDLDVARKSNADLARASMKLALNPHAPDYVGVEATGVCDTRRSIQVIPSALLRDSPASRASTTLVKVAAP